MISLKFEISSFDPIHDERGAKVIPYQLVLTFTFSPFPMSRSCPVLDIELELRPPLKKPVVFKSNPYKVKVMVNSLIEMLGSPNFGHFTILAI